MKIKQKKWILMILVVCLAVILSGCASDKYKEAQELFEAQNYAEAQKIFTEIEDHEDSGKYLAYIATVKEADAGRFAQASEAFAALSGFQDSDKLSIYYAARQAETEERYEDADALYQQLGTFMDSATRKNSLPELIEIRDERIRSEKYTAGQQVFEKGNFAEAVTVFEELGDYQEAGKYVAYVAAVKEAEAGRFAQASEAFATLSGFQDSDKLSIYYAARQAEIEERYEDADAMYQLLDSFMDSATRKNALPELIEKRNERNRVKQYAQGQTALSNGDYETAITIFDELSNYEESSKYLMYARALKLAEEGNYELAINSFASLEDFSDSKLQMTYYTACQAEAEQRYEDAELLYKSVATFRDSMDRMVKLSDMILDRDFAIFRTALMSEAPEWDANFDPYYLFTAEYSDSETRMLDQFVHLGDDALAAGLYGDAFTIFDILNRMGYAGACAHMQDCCFAWAENEIKNDNYMDAEYVLLDDGTVKITSFENYTYILFSSNSWFGANNQYSDRPILCIPTTLDGYTVTSIDSNVFSGENFKQEAYVIIPASLLEISPNAFGDNCVHRYVVAGDHPKYLTINDMLYEKDSMTLIDWCGVDDDNMVLESLIIPDGTRIIGESAFERACVKEIILPQSLERIERCAFYQSYELERCYIPDGVSHLGDAAFFQCIGLKKIVLPKSLTTMGDSVFHTCTSLTQIELPDGLMELANGVFAYCTSLQQVILSEGLEQIGDGVFCCCYELESIEIPQTVKCVGSEAFYCCTKMERIVLPEGLNEIDYNAFNECHSLKEVNIPLSLQKIDTLGGLYPFLKGCDNLERITVPQDHPVFTLIDGALIRKADGLLMTYPKATETEEIVIPDCVKSIDAYAFYNNRNLKTVVIPEGVMYIGEEAFGYCKNLREITLPLSLNSEILTIDTNLSDEGTIHHYILSECSQLVTIHIGSEVTEEIYHENKSKILKLYEYANEVMREEVTQRDAKIALIPYVLPKDRFDALTRSMRMSTRKKTQSNYKEVTQESLLQEENFINYDYSILFPDGATQPFYILKWANAKEQLKEYFAEIGYTNADYENDLQYIDPQYLQYGATGEIEMVQEYSTANNTLLLSVQLSNPKVIRYPDLSDAIYENRNIYFDNERKSYFVSGGDYDAYLFVHYYIDSNP